MSAIGILRRSGFSVAPSTQGAEARKINWIDNKGVPMTIENPSLTQIDPGQEEKLKHTRGPWNTRPSIQRRLTIYSESQHKPICTILNADRIDPANLKLILAAPRVVRALIRLRAEELRAKYNWDVHSPIQLDAAIEEATEALAEADIKL
jgi:hypothetical protein